MPPDALAAAYPHALWTHIALVTISVGLFAARGLGVLAGQTWPMQPLWCRASMLIDTALLAAGGILWAMLQLNPLHDTWLGAKLVLLVVYIGLGTLALKRAPSRAAKAVCFLAALGCVGTMAAIAVRHNPLAGWT